MKLRAAISGFGNVAALGHLPAWRGRHDLEIVAVHDPIADRRREAERLIPGARIYDDLVKMLAVEKPGFVDIASPPSHHANAAQMALEAGAHALVEKPLCLDLGDFDRLAKFAASRALVLRCVHNWQYAPPYKRALELAREGRLGKLQSISLTRLRTAHAGGAPWRIDPKTGGGILVDHGWHVFYLIQAFSRPARPQSISARLTHDSAANVDVAADLSVSFSGGLVATAHLSWRASSRRTLAQLEGDEAKLEIDGDHVVLIDRVGAAHDLSVGDSADDSYHSAWFIEVADRFVSAVRSGTRPLGFDDNLEEARTALALTTSAMKSNAESGKPVMIDTFPA